MGAHHRHHHAHSDQEGDIHSPKQVGFWRAHMGWFLSHRGFTPDMKYVRDLLQFRELRWLDRFDIAVPVLLGVGMFVLGVVLEKTAPHLQTTGWQMLIWGFFISTVLCYHGTYTINSLSHVLPASAIARATPAATLAAGDHHAGWWWHNNHHFYPNSARQGFYWWEIDVSYYVLKMLSLDGNHLDLKPVRSRCAIIRRVASSRCALSRCAARRFVYSR